MGTFTHPMTLIGPLGGQTVDCVVDTDVLFAVIPGPVLKRVGVKPARVFRERSRAPRQRALAQVRAELGGHEGFAMCVFGDADQPARVGRHTLDTFLLEPDFAKRQLVPKVLRLISHG